MIDIESLSYLGVLAAAAIEGEIVFVAASSLVAAGHLSAVGVGVAGALGAAIGDQCIFFAIRRPTSRWLARRSTAPLPGSVTLLAWVRRHQVLAAFAVRFVPGLRIAVTTVCAAAGISAWRFSAVNLVAAAVWAGAVMGMVAYGGPAALGQLGLGPWVSAAATALAGVALTLAGSALMRRKFLEGNRRIA